MKSCLGAKAAILYISANQSWRARGNYVARMSLRYAWWTPLYSFLAEVKMPSGNVDKPVIEDNHDGTVSIKYEPREEGLHEIYVKFNGEHVQGKLIHSSCKLTAITQSPWSAIDHRKFTEHSKNNVLMYDACVIHTILKHRSYMKFHSPCNGSYERQFTLIINLPVWQINLLHAPWPSLNIIFSNYLLSNKKTFFIYYLS